MLLRLKSPMVFLVFPLAYNATDGKTKKTIGLFRPNRFRWRPLFSHKQPPPLNPSHPEDLIGSGGFPSAIAMHNMLSLISFLLSYLPYSNWIRLPLKNFFSIRQHFSYIHTCHYLIGVAFRKITTQKNPLGYLAKSQLLYQANYIYYIFDLL